MGGEGGEIRTGISISKWEDEANMMKKEKEKKPEGQLNQQSQKEILRNMSDHSWIDEDPGVANTSINV
jgi:hypothetical protein